jgi:hypothetical protein
MSFLAINNEVKCAFRWYATPSLRNRNLKRCEANMSADHNEEGCEDCVWAINSPITNFPPFQILAATGGQVGFSTPVSWKVYDLDGVELVDLSGDLDKLTVVEFADPTREYIIYDGDALTVPLPPNSLVESVIEMEGERSLYSETVRTFCTEAGGILENTDFSDGTINWEYAPWTGFIVDVENVPGDPSYGSPETGDKVINIADNLLYTWNGTAWVSSVPDDGSYFSESVIGGPWHQFLGGEFLSPATPPVTTGDGIIICWNGTGDVAFNYFPDGPVTFPGSFTLSFTFFHGVAILGEVEIWIGETLVATIDESLNGQQVDVTVILTGANQVHIRPAAGFRACMTMFVGVEQLTSNCRYMLEYSNCGDLSTQAYGDRSAPGWENRIYLDDDVFLEPPIPQLSNEVDESGTGDNNEVFRRKQVVYGLQLGRIPWWFLDAITEIPEHDTVTLTDMSTLGDDSLYNISVDAPWGPDKCLTTGCLLSFQAFDDATVNAGCCDEFGIPCVAPCADVSGFYGDPDPILDEFYLIEDANEIAQYLGFDNGPVDVNGYDVPFPCESGFAHGINGFYDYYWNVTEWTRLSGISYEYADFTCGVLNITGFGHPRYDLRLQYSLDASTWLDFDPDQTFGPLDIESPFAVNINNISGPGSLFLRLEVFGPGDCVVGYSNVCQVYCQSMIDQTIESKLDWTFQSGGTSVWTDVADEAALASLTPDPGDIALTLNNNQFYYWDGDSWEFCSIFTEGAVQPPVYVTGTFELGTARMCTTIAFDAIQGTITPDAEAGTPYQLQIQITGGMIGQFHFPGTFDVVSFNGAGYYTGIITPVLTTDQFYIDLSPSTEPGCITNISIRPLCEE